MLAPWLALGLVLGAGPAAAQDQSTIGALVGGAAGSLEKVRAALTLNQRTQDLLTYGVGIGAFGVALGLGLGAAAGAFGVSAEANQGGVQIGAGIGTTSGATGGGIAAPAATR